MSWHAVHREGISWADIEWVDNSQCLDLIERVSLCYLCLVQPFLPPTVCWALQKLGVLDLLDEESRFPKGTDKTLLEKLHGALKVGGALQEGWGFVRGWKQLGAFSLLRVTRAVARTTLTTASPK